MFESLGLTARQELVYRRLLDEPDRTVAELAGRVALPMTAVRTALRALGELGLVEWRAARPRRVSAVPPDIAVEALISRRQEEFARVRHDAARLAARARAAAAAADPGRPVEVVTGAEQIAARFSALQRASRSEVAALVDLPVVIDAIDADAEQGALARGVRYRAIYSVAALDDLSRRTSFEQFVAAGEQARLLPRLPLKLAVFDHTTALVPLLTDPATYRAAAVVVHSSTLLDALRWLFESLWSAAVPVGPEPDGAAPAEEERLLALLAAGAKDEAIARQLGLSARTTRRRIAALLDRLDGGTRFAAGYRAGLVAAGVPPQPGAPAAPGGREVAGPNRPPAGLATP